MKLITDFAIDTQILTENTVEGTKRLFITGPFLMHSKENRNKRVYSKKGMDLAVKRYTEEYIKTSRSLGEMNHPCFDETANVFVEGRGLVPIKDVKIGDYVIGVNANNEGIRSQVFDVTVNHFEGNLLKFDSRLFSAIVTPYHRFFLKNRKGELNVYTAQEIKDSFLDRRLSHDYIPTTVENWIGGVENDTIILQQTTERFAGKVHDYAKTPLEIRFKEFCAFMGIFLAEGNVSYKTRVDGTKVPSEVQISQNVGDRLDLIMDLISDIGINASTVRITADGVKAVVCISDVRLADYLSQFGNVYEKYIPDVILQSSVENIKEFLTWYHLGDGTLSTQCKDGVEYSQSNVFTVSEKLANGLIECIIKSGNSTTKRIQLSKSDYTFAGRTIQIKNKVPLYRMTIGRSKGKYVDGRFMTVNEVPYVGNVYCLKTETSNFYVEQNGKVFLSGNCGRLQVDPERACILTTSLEPDGNYYHGKAKVLSTPLGKVLEALLNDGVKIGVSSRGVGSVTKRGNVTMVGEDFALSCAADIVADPSVGDAFVQHLMEEREYILIGGQYIEKDLFEAKAKILKAPSIKLEEAKLMAFQDFLNKIKA